MFPVGWLSHVAFARVLFGFATFAEKEMSLSTRATVEL